MGVQLVGLIVLLGALWDLFASFLGMAQFFDLPLSATINPIQFTFALIATFVVFGFVIASHLIWSLKSDDFPTLLLKIAWVFCLVINFFSAWAGTNGFVFYGDSSTPPRLVGLIVMTFLIVASSILLSKLMLAKDVRGKPFLF